MAQLLYMDAKGAGVGIAIRTRKRASAVMSHVKHEARLITDGPEHEKIGEIYWHDDPCADCTVRIGGSHWCYWYDPDALTD